MATKAKKAKKPGGIFLPGKGYTGTEVAVRLGRPVLRAGSEIGLGALANAPKVSAWKYRWLLGPIAAVIGLTGELVLDDSPTGRLIKGPLEGAATWGIKDTLASAMPAQKQKLGLGSMGQERGSYSKTLSEGGDKDWAAIARMMTEDENSPATTTPSVSGTDTEPDMGNWLQEVDYEEVLSMA